MKLSMQQLRALSVASWSPMLYASLPDVLLIAGSCSASYGAWLVYPPAGFIVAGVLLMFGGFLASRKFG